MWRQKLPKCLVSLLAITAIGLAMFAATGRWHHHDTLAGHGCQVCHVGHQPVLEPLSDVPALRPVCVAWHRPTEEFVAKLEPAHHSSCSRAPPA